AKMQFDSGVAADIIQVIQALVLAFVAAPMMIRALFRIRQAPEGEEETTLSASWSGT
ncbi:MAG: ABC transporter permease, partial [Caldilineae bacterium]